MSAFLYEKEDVVDMIHDTLTYHDLLEIKKRRRNRTVIKMFYHQPRQKRTAAIWNPRACLKNAFREMCFTLGGEFIPNL